MPDTAAVTTILFTDIEGSTRLWEEEPERMRVALARHDQLGRAAVQAHRGDLVKSTGDGLHAVFRDPLDAIAAMLDLQRGLADASSTGGMALHVRAGLHAGVIERRDNDYFGSAVNRAARIMSVAHGGQMLVSDTVAHLVRDRLPAGIALRELGSVRLRDLLAPERVWQVLEPTLRHDFPALRSLEATPNNLPQQVTTFVGREREVAEVRELLARGRLVTLCGVGGLGKTRLSLQVAAEVVGDFADGVWLVEFAALADGRLVPQAVATVLGVKETGGVSLVDTLVRFVRDRKLLLILDNCEHLIGACAELAARLLAAGHDVRILASSRESLRVAGETSYVVPALAVPEAERPVAPDALARYAAVRLFLERAAAVQPQFRLTERNAGVVGEICRRLDGIPLAIELAAARLRALSAEDIAAHLDDRFRLLRGGDRTALPRQQTLRALIDWSHDLLTDRERIAFRRLAVFAGGWTLAAAEAVGTGGEIASADVLDLLTELVDKSLVAVDAETGRYRLLETVREYARGRLVEAREEAPAQDRHLAYYVDLAETARSGMSGPHQASWLAHLDAERENLLAAHAWCGRDPRRGPTGLQLVTAMKQYFIRRGQVGLAERMTSEALANPGARSRDAERSRALFSLGQIRFSMGRYGDARPCLEESLEIGRETGDRQRIAAALQPLGLALVGLGDLPGARRCFDEAIALAREIGNKRELATALSNRAQLHRFERDPEAGQPLQEQALSLLRELDDRENIAVALLNLAMIEIGRGAGDAALGMLREALAIVAETGSKPASQSVVEVAAGLAANRGEWDRAVRLFGAAEAHAAQTGLQRDPADEAFLAPLIERARANSSAAQFAGAEAAGRALGLDDVLCEIRAWLGAGSDARSGPDAPTGAPTTGPRGSGGNSSPPGLP